MVESQPAPNEKRGETTSAGKPAASGHEASSARVSSRRPLPPRSRSFFWPLLLIGLGIVFLLSNLGFLPGNIWNILWRFWPLLLIIAGVDLLLGRRSALGAILTFLLALILIGGAVGVTFFAQGLPNLVDIVDNVELKRETISYPRDGIKQAEIIIDWTSGPAQLKVLEDSNNLIEGDIGYYGDLVFNVTTRGNQARVELDSRPSGILVGPTSFQAGDDRWNVYLSPDLLLDLDLDLGSGPANLDLKALQVENLRIDVGSGPVELILPERGAVQATIDGGSGPLNIVFPEGMEAGVTLVAGSGAFRPAARFQRVQSDGDGGDGVWETAGLQGADNFVELRIDQGSGSITLE